MKTLMNHFVASNLRVMGILGAMVLAVLMNVGSASARPRGCVGDFTLTSETR